MNDIGERIKILRKEEKLKQIDFSKRLLLSQSYLSSVESGRENPTDKVLKLICLEFGVNESWLLSGDGEMYSDLFENDKDALVEISNSVLLKFLLLLSTKSNVEYGLYAETALSGVGILGATKQMNSDQKVEYLKKIEKLTMDLERLIIVSSGGVSKSKFKDHQTEVNSDMESLYSFVISFCSD